MTSPVESIGLLWPPRDLDDVGRSGRSAGGLEVTQYGVDAIGQRGVLSNHSNDRVEEAIATIGEPDLVTEIARSPGPGDDLHGESINPASERSAMVVSTSAAMESALT
jgi:hypothetical protein